MTDNPQTPTPPDDQNSYNIPPPAPSGPPSYNRPPRRKKSSPWKAIIVVAVILFVLGGGGLILLLMVGALAGGPVGVNNYQETLVREGTSGSKVVIVPIHGIILNGSAMFSTVAASDDVIAKLRRAAKDDKVKAVILDINSPGGEITATDEIHHEIQKLREKKKVFTCMRSVAASGGYYIAAGTDYIFANRLTMTGSIGVIMGGVNYSGLLDKVGVRDNTYKSGQLKDMGSPARLPLTQLKEQRIKLQKRKASLTKTLDGANAELRNWQEAEIKLVEKQLAELAETEALILKERKVIQGMVNDSFREFAQVVAKGRKLPLETVMAAPIGDARILPGPEALKLKLVDELGYMDDVIDHACKTGEHRVVRYDPIPTLFDALAGSAKSQDFVERLIPPEYTLIKKGRLYYLNPNLF